MLDPDDYHRRAQECRDRAAQEPALANKFLEAAALWELIAQQVSTHIRAKESTDKAVAASPARPGQTDTP